jgi:hypothetical protein
MHICDVIVNNMDVGFPPNGGVNRPEASAGGANRVLIFRMNKFNSETGR